MTDVNLERGYRRVLSGVNFTVAAGELWQLAGANGVGKTSLIRALAGLVKIGLEGEIVCNVSLLYQGHALALKPLLTAEENLQFHPSGGVSREREAINHALETVGLAGYETQPVNQLSAGQQRRVGLARLWLDDARLWLLDEPFTAIDVVGAALLESRITEHVADGGSVIFTSHQDSRFGEALQTLDLARYAP